jgi:asparagine synthase (glutamine-hydrolysing)
MCGIYGFLNSNRDPVPSSDLLGQMGRVVVHRGPNDQGQYIEGPVAFGIRRLSIIDLAGGHQPISNESESVWVVCNGEVYNYRELRKELEARGHRFRSQSDTEVLVHLYEEEGPEFVKRLRGMFAFALWDRKRSRLLLARDRLGKKPLYVRRGPERLLFASELKSILQAPEVPRELDVTSLQEYLALGYVPAPGTLLEGIEKVLPGHYMQIEDERIKTVQYWDASFNFVEHRSEQDWIELVRAKLLEAVRVRLVSDVPLGAFLSGGIDSSSVVAAVSKLTGQPVKTYSIGFEGRDEFYNELPYASIVAKAFATDHHEIIVRPQVSDLLPKLIWHLDEPIADSAFITTYLVSQLARESVTVILSGVGGDELFGGYRRYLGDNLVSYYRRVPAPVRKFLRTVLTRLPQDRHSAWKNNIRYASAFADSAERDAASRYMSYVTVFSPDLRAQLLREHAEIPGEVASQLMQRYFVNCRDADALNSNIYVDLKTSLPDDLLALTDRMSMAASIECRAPFVDQELVELAGRIPSGLKIRGLTLKYLLKKVVEPWLPPEILKRGKRGFGAPVGSWLRTDLRELVEDTLSEEQVRKRGLFDPVTVRTIIARQNTGRNDCTEHLLSLINLELWCRAFLHQAPSQPAPELPSAQTRPN